MQLIGDTETETETELIKNIWDRKEGGKIQK